MSERRAIGPMSAGINVAAQAEEGIESCDEGATRRPRNKN